MTVGKFAILLTHLSLQILWLYNNITLLLPLLPTEKRNYYATRGIYHLDVSKCHFGAFAETIDAVFSWEDGLQFAV